MPILFKLSVIHYKVIVHTADKNLAGTDAKVSIILHGELGDADPIVLDQEGRNLFERGSYVLLLFYLIVFHVIIITSGRHVYIWSFR